LTDYRAFPCEDCGGTGSVRVHGAEDYGVSFECEQCEHCGGTGTDVEALHDAYRGAVERADAAEREAARLRTVNDGLRASLRKMREDGEAAIRRAGGR
jgi:DnaJ-class molecular chaperone